MKIFTRKFLVVGLFFVVLTAIPLSAKAIEPCCTITGIDQKSGIITAKESATGHIFQFKVNGFDPVDSVRLMNHFRVGQKVFVNFRAGKVSLDGNKTCCSLAAKPGLGSPGRETSLSQSNGGRPTTSSPASSLPFKEAGGAGQREQLISPIIPRVSSGSPQMVQNSGSRLGNLRPHGGFSNSQLVRLHGISGIKKATGLPEGTQDFLLMHAKTLPPGEVDNYVVNPKLAEEWFKTHPLPDSVKKAARKGDGHKGCKSISLHCAGEAGKHAEDEASRQSQKMIEEAEGEWKHISREAAHDWGMAEDCFSDHTLHLDNVPVKFSIDPKIPLSFEKDGKASNKNGGASGSVKGTVTYGLPVEADFTARVDLFYIPCLPFAVRPKSIGADGNMGVGSGFEAAVTANGQFNRSFPIPPSGGPHFPIYVIPIVIAGVPVAELDVSVYIDGTLDVYGEGNLKGNLKLQTIQKTAFDFECSGKNCRLSNNEIPEPATAAESVKIDGRVTIKPAIYVALQLDFDTDVLSARAGPQPYLKGEIYGCGAASGAQNTAGMSTGEQSYALTADLDWGIELRAEALVGPKKVAEKKRGLLQKHIYFKDLAQSTALIPGIGGTSQPMPGQPALYSVKMPACYPYQKDQVEYRVKWTGGATPENAQNTSGSDSQSSRLASAKFLTRGAPSSNHSAQSPCQMQSGQGDCWADPMKNTSFNLIWPQMGNYNLTVTAIGDKHGRKFDPPIINQLDINVQQ